MSVDFRLNSFFFLYLVEVSYYCLYYLPFDLKFQKASLRVMELIIKKPLSLLLKLTPLKFYDLWLSMHIDLFINLMSRMLFLNGKPEE